MAGRAGLLRSTLQPDATWLYTSARPEIAAGLFRQALRLGRALCDSQREAPREAEHLGNRSLSRGQIFAPGTVGWSGFESVDRPERRIMLVQE
jgi:hypothetical protein